MSCTLNNQSCQIDWCDSTKDCLGNYSLKFIRSLSCRIREYESVMRAKEYLEINKKKIYHYDLVKKAVYDLYPLRNNKIQTEVYFNRYLFADARYRSHEQFYADKPPSTIFNEREYEVERSIAHKIRMEILNVISEDDTFIFAYNIIALGANKYGDYHRIMTCNLKEENLNTIPGIEQVCKEYKEDYPKTSLADYLLDDDNREVFNSKRCDLQKDEDWWLCAFNKAYEIFDLIRVKAADPFKAQYIVKNIFFNDKVIESTFIYSTNNNDLGVSKTYITPQINRAEKIKVIFTTAMEKKKNITSKIKAEIVLSLLRGEDIELISRKYGATLSDINHWRDQFIKNGIEGFKRKPDDSKLSAAERKIGQLQMGLELTKKKNELTAKLKRR